MFKLESYVTPYILAYLGKYFKNFDASDFQMSLWGGGAVFQNLYLNLPVLDQELNLPVTFVSGHINELKISVPWTKVTSEPIQVYINTIEVTLKLKNFDDDQEIPVAAKPPPPPKLEPEEHLSERPPPGYMQNLISKILNNVHVNFENVIVKYVREDIVLSLNIKRVNYCTVDGDWIPAFVDLIAPDFILRKKFLFSDLTVCLDKTNTAGRIETYQEPLLYRCTFEVRIFQQFKSAFSKLPYFTRMDFHMDDMDFTFTDEQIPMIMRLYSLMQSLFNINIPEDVPKESTNLPSLQADSGTSSKESKDEDDRGGGTSTPVIGWGSWAFSWLPPISAVLGEEVEDGDNASQNEGEEHEGSTVINVPEDWDSSAYFNEPEEVDSSTIICLYGFNINKVSVTFKALERSCDQPRYGRAIKVKFLPFLKCSLQGIIGDFVRDGSGKISTANFTCNQFVFSLVEDPAEITWSCTSATVSSRVRSTNYDLGEAEHITADIYIKSISGTSTLQNRSSPVVTPFNIHVEAGCEWKPWLEYPMVTLTITLDPVALYIGPQSILAFLLIRHVFKGYLDQVIIVEDEIISMMEGPATSTVKMICDSFKDDLRAGSFKFVRVPSSLDLPKVYQIAFCEQHRTMTWRYPQHRILSSIQASPVPIDTDRVPSFKKKKLDCTVEYWDDAMCQFLYYGSFSLSEQDHANVEIPAKDKLHCYNSNIWRIKIETPMEESDSKHLIRPEILAACLKVDSIHDSSLAPKLKLYLEVPRISINFVNNFFLGGRGPNKLVSQYSNNSLKQFDQPFSKINLEMTSILVSAWVNHCTVDYNSYVKLDVLDYEFMTLTRVVDPVLLKTTLSLHDMESANYFNSELEVIWKHLTVKFGAATLHTLLSSLTSWKQLLEAWDGRKINLAEIAGQESINVNQILVLNTTDSQIKLHQSGADGSTFIRGGECAPFYWSTHKEKPLCKLGVKEKEWAYSCHFDLKKSGYVVRNVHQRPMFIHVSNFLGSQRLVTVTGNLFVGNTLNEDLEVAALPCNKTSEVIWKVGSGHYGSSQMLEIEQIEHFRFRIFKEGKAEPWSRVVTPGALIARAKEDRSMCTSLFEEEGGKLTEFCVWVSLIEETIGESEASRFLIMLSPFFRLRSLLPCETTVHISTLKQSSRLDYSLGGMGAEMQIDFTGSHKVAHHLTFQSTPLGSASTPSIPLIPEGPMFQVTPVQRKIDDLLSQIMGVKFGERFGEKEEACSERIWPFISEVIGKDEWTFSEQKGTDLDVVFSTWIEGLPTVLLEIKPSILIVNLLGTDLLFSHIKGPGDEDWEWEHKTIPHKGVFSPGRISLGGDRFKLGLILNEIKVRSEKLRFSEEKYRTDVHHGNLDGWIPIDSFSRLDIHSDGLIGCLTIETRMKNKVLVMTIRPTFSIMNKSSEEIFVQHLSMSSSLKQKPESWTEDKMSKYLSLRRETGSIGVPLITCISDEREYSADMKSVKYLALSCGGPWWFVKLMDFAIIFDNMNSSQGVPASAKGVTLPKYKAELEFPKHVSPNHLDEFQLKTVTSPIVVSWTSKNGQVWISLSDDPCPQVVLCNFTRAPFLYVQSDEEESMPFREAEAFEQYLVLSPNSKAHYTFAQKYAGFPQMMGVKVEKLPNLLMTELPGTLIHGMISDSTIAERFCDTRKINQNGVSEGRRFLKKDKVKKKPCGTLLFPADGVDLHWSKELNVNGEPLQYFSVHKFIAYRIRIEKLGFTYYVYIENMSSVEVAAKDVRKRIANPTVGLSDGNLINSSVVPKKSSAPTVMTPRSGSDYFSSRSSFSSSIRLRPDDLYFSTQKNIFNETLVCSPVRSDISPWQSWSFRCYIPKLTILLMEDLISATERRELLSFTAEDFFFEQIPQWTKKPFRCLLNRTKESWLTSIRIGSVQIDSPGFPFERTCDFPVILKQEAIYKGLVLPEKYGRNELQSFYNLLKKSNNCMISCTITYGQSSPDYHCMESVSISSKAFLLNVEDRLIDFVVPSMEKIYSVIEEQLLQITALSKVTEPDGKIEEKYFGCEDGSVTPPGSSSSRTESYSNKSLMIDGTNYSDSNHSSKVAYPNCFSVGKVLILPESSGQVGLQSKHFAMSGKQYNSWGSNEHIDGSHMEKNNKEKSDVGDEDSKNLPVNTIVIPEEIWIMLENFSNPTHIESFKIEPLEVCLSLRIARLLYLAVDHSRLQIPEFGASGCVTTSYNLGQALSSHYTTGAIFQIGNPVRLIGSLELLGSPGSLVQSVGTGLKDFVVFPYQGIFQGPTGFVAGLGNGVTSLVKSVTSGALTSVTNWAWSVSRNIDKLTLDEEEQILTEGARRVQLDGFTDGFIRGLTGFGIRLLGAVGGIAHHPIQNVIQGGATPSNVIQGVGRGVLGVVTRPIGGIVELVAMTGQGVLRGAGWTPQLKTKGETLIEEVWNNPNSLFKYQIVLKGEDETEQLFLLVDAVQPNGKGGLTPVSLLLSTQNLYVIDVSEDLVISHFPVNLLTLEMSEDRDLICLRTTAALDRNTGSSTSPVVGEYIVSPHDKAEFENVLYWVKINQDEQFFKV